MASTSSQRSVAKSSTASGYKAGYVDVQRSRQEISYSGKTKSSHSSYRKEYAEVSGGGGGRAVTTTRGSTVATNGRGGSSTKAVSYNEKTTSHTTRVKIPNPAAKRPGPTIIERQVVKSARTVTAAAKRR